MRQAWCLCVELARLLGSYTNNTTTTTTTTAAAAAATTTGKWCVCVCVGGGGGGGIAQWLERWIRDRKRYRV